MKLLNITLQINLWFILMIILFFKWIHYIFEAFILFSIITCGSKQQSVAHLHLSIVGIKYINLKYY